MERKYHGIKKVVSAINSMAAGAPAGYPRGYVQVGYDPAADTLHYEEHIGSGSYLIWSDGIINIGHFGGKITMQYLKDHIDAAVKAAESKLWYAVMRDNDDTDWGYGSDDLAKAQEMLKVYPDGYIAVIDESGSEPMCVEEIH